MNEISRLLTGRIIWLNSLRPVNLTDFPLKQHTVPNALNPKNIAKTGELPKTRWAVTLTVGGPGLTPSLYAMDILFVLFPHDSVLKSFIFAARSHNSDRLTSEFSKIITVTVRSRLFVPHLLENLRIVEISPVYIAMFPVC